MIETPHITESAPQLVAKIHLTVPRSEIQVVMGPGIREVMAAVASQGVGPAGPWLSHHLKMEPDIFDFEICVPVRTPVSPVGRVVPGELRGARVGRTVMHGDYAELAGAWGELMAWMRSQHLEPAADLWEIYTVGPETSPNPADWRTELNRPIAG